MPKLTDETKEARRAAILAAAEICFARDGYQATSVDGICREAGISVGAFYVYFRKKEDVVVAMAGLEGASKSSAFEGIGEGALLHEAEFLFDLLKRIGGAKGAHWARLDLDLWSESMRNADLRKVSRGAIDQMQTLLEELIGRSAEDNRLSPDVDRRGLAHVLVAVALGLEVQQALGVKMNFSGIVSAMRLLSGSQWRQIQGSRPFRRRRPRLRRGR